MVSTFLFQAVSMLLPIIVLLGIAVLIFGVFQFFRSAGDQAKRGRALRLVGLGAALVVILGFFGFSGLETRRASYSLDVAGGSMGTGALFVPDAYPSAPSRATMGGAYGESDGYAEDSRNSYAADRAMLLPPGAPMPSPTEAPAGDSKIVKTGHLYLLVDDVPGTMSSIHALRVRYGGEPGNATQYGNTGTPRRGNITIWVPSERFDAALADIKALAVRVDQETIGVEDVSARFVDLEARLKNLRSAETQYADIMKRSGKISEVLDVTRELTNVRAQIEQIEGQLNYLSRKVALSSITAEIYEETSPIEVRDEWRPVAVLKASAKNALKELTNFADDLIRLLLILPVLFLELVFWVGILFAAYWLLSFVYRRFLRDHLPAIPWNTTIGKP